ncbi:hypothetical protein VW29_16285 [Devosia limi DSM 17137]|uniref:UDP-glucose 4-epimerase n=1 Tax=Devosia limi DSM 17137 TaxID=1121477 RepID=A0A0F5LJ43_9HYPH|nr:NAD-dependent epimerase/dehydratase family protein [Devosia limi]KKB82373.1 hypothetical protein VW29_16285 [Devosia limi DSM 17137]SHE64293.1 UDP-glucose 4-epimerase [Devosia limi DSM 17137]
MHIVIVGGNGFIGRNFSARAERAGHRITIVGRSVDYAGHHDYLPGGQVALAASPSLLVHADLVCHLASSTIPATADADPIGDVQTNLVDTLRLLEAMRHSGNGRLLYLSSGGAIYGAGTSVPICEDHPTDPLSAYGIAKLAVEKYLAMYARTGALHPMIIRPSNAYGSGQASYGRLGAVTTFFNLAVRGERATIWGNGTVVRDYIHVSDICELMLRAAEERQTGIYNCGSGRGTSLLDLLALIETITGKPIARDMRPPRPFDPPAIVLDTARARSTFGWVPKVSLESGVRMLLENPSQTSV